MATSLGGGAHPSYVCNLPADVAAGDLLIVGAGSDAALTSFSWPGSWVELADIDDASVGLTVGRLIAVGGETTVTLTGAGTADNVTCHALRITAASWHGTTAPEANQQDNGAASEFPDAGASLDPAGWGTEASLWIIFLATHSAATVDAYPTNYVTNGAHTDQGADGGISSSWREATAASEDPGTWDLSVATNLSMASVVAVRPAAVAATAGPLINSTPLKSLVGGGLAR